MIPRHLFLVMLDHACGAIAGKTLAQKRAYFVTVMTGEGPAFVPHYYGPFSAELDEAIASCKALGFVHEEVSSFSKADAWGFEVRRYTYRLTDDGQKVVANLEVRNPDDVRRVREALSKLRQAGDDNYVKLSVAAKVHCLLQTRRGKSNPEDLVEAARQFGWDLASQQIDEACQFLMKLGLIS